MSSLMTPYIQEGYSAVRAEAIFGRDSVLGSGAPNCDGLYRAASVEELFGPASERGDGGIFDNMVYGLGDEPLFHILLVVTLVAYLYMLLRSWKFIRSIHIDVLENRSEQRLIAEGGVLPTSLSLPTRQYLAPASPPLRRLWHCYLWAYLWRGSMRCIRSLSGCRVCPRCRCSPRWCR